MKVSVAARDRLRALGGATYEETISEALDALEADRFWTQAETAAARRVIPSKGSAGADCRVRGRR